MIITIYDYANNTKEITLPDKEIAEIFVNVISGDETGFVKFVDGTKIKFDASDNRFTDYYDGDYTLKGKNIKKWIDFKPSGNRTASYERQGIFDTEEECEDEVLDQSEADMNREQIIANTVRKIQEDVAIYFGTYTDKDEVKVSDVVRLINRITEEMMEEAE